MDSIFSTPRKSALELGKIYFWTATIRNWQCLLLDDSFKMVITSSLENLSSRKLIDVFAFVVMPNHIHLIWRLNKMNGAELPSASLLKFTAHRFKKLLTPGELAKYYVDAANKSFEFWQRDSLGIELFSPNVAYQKLDYLHLNPLGEKWNLATDPCGYKFSSASFYESGNTNFTFINHLGNEF
ncbi:MAG: transposase [Cyclobacteriaceae bacterium]